MRAVSSYSADPCRKDMQRKAFPLVLYTCCKIIVFNAQSLPEYNEIAHNLIPWSIRSLEASSRLDGREIPSTYGNRRFHKNTELALT